MRINNKSKKIICLFMAAAFVCASVTACGSGSKESKLDGSNIYPDEYPVEQTEYCRLKDCTFEVINEAGK